MRAEWRTILLAVVAGSGCDSGGPGDTAGFDFAATVDGTQWVADTGIAQASASPTDTIITITAARRVSPTEEQEITLSLQSMGSGQFPLGDIASPAVGAFAIFQVSGDSVTGVASYLTRSTTSGTLTISSLRRSDSLIAGSFAFESSLLPDTVPHRQVTGHFRVRYTMQTVFLP